MNVVRDNALLERRIKYFIESGRGGRQHATALIQALSEQSHLYVFGGLIRDISLYTAHHFRSDIDLVYAGSRTQLEKALEGAGTRKISENKFGGFRVHDTAVEIDIWSLEETWAFRHHFINLSSVESLLSTTLMTWDAVLYDIRNSKIITTESWLQDLHTGRLDLVLEKTPDVNRALIKILRTVYGKHVLTLGERLSSFLQNALDDVSDAELIRCELQRFGDHYLSSARLFTLRRMLERWQGTGDLRVNNHLHYKQIPLIFE